MERYIEIAIITAQATYCVDTLDVMESECKFLRKVGEEIERIEVRCYEKDSDEIFDSGECICTQVIG